MQALDRFISPIPIFNGDVPILIVPNLTWSPGDESISEPSTDASASTSKTRAGMQKVTTNLTCQKKAKNVVGRFAGGVKINEPTSKAPASTSPPGPR
jgi:hypothetical protein